MSKRKWIGNLLLIITAVIWGTAFVFQRVGMESIEPITFTAARMSMAAAAIGLVTAIVHRMSRKKNTAAPTVSRQHTVIGGIVCGCFLAGASILQQIGIVDTSAGKAGFITSLYILMVPVINLLLFRKKSPFRVWLAVLSGLVGMYLLCVKENFSLTFGDTMIAGCALLFSGHILCCDYFAKRADPLLLSTIQFITTAILSAVVAFLTESPSWEKIVSAIIPILYCGIVSGGIGYTLQMVAQKFTDPTIASLLMSLESVFAALAGALLLHESMSLQEFCGCVVLFAAIILAQLPRSSKHNR